MTVTQDSPHPGSTSERVLILGAAGRDFHIFNVCFRDDPRYRVVAFTAAQIPGIESRRYPASLSGSLYPDGIPIYPEDKLEELIRSERMQQVVFAYSDIAHIAVMHLASRALACGADFRLIGPDRSMIAASRPVISVCAVRTGCGKDSVIRRIATLLKERRLRPVVVRHPMPYGDLSTQVVQRFASVEDCDRAQCTIEEREEYEQHIRNRVVVFAGVDYARILAEAEKEADVILWDGGNNDWPFYRSDLEIVLLDPHRAGHELRYHPCETNLRRSQVLIVNKVDSAPAGRVEEVMENIARINPGATVIKARSTVGVDKPELIRGKRVLLIEDGPTLTHGEMAYGAGRVAAEKYGAAEIVDPKPAARGSLRETFEHFPWVERALPAMGYSKSQLDDLAATIAAVDCDTVVIATPVDLARLIPLAKPRCRVRYDLEEISRPDLADIVAEFMRAHAAHLGRR
ncbi:MAG TPA: cyclic 2,3-diphosphoglycerate synthase [Candidatus Limnocylindria bacterium]|nr:cyclic 2,3-diphosphoglycerate synthase [Candidatus Limnocylindria bacterium]